MLAPDRIRLLYGPYATPSAPRGAVLFDEARDCEVVVRGLTDARKPWPIGIPMGGRGRSLIVFGGLANAVRRESAIAICHWWGVTGQTVTRWRKALQVPVTNEGTHRLRSEYTDEDWSIKTRKKGHAKNGDPQRRAKIAAAKRGEPRPWRVIKKMIDAKTGSKHSAEAKAKMSAAHKRLGTRPPKAGRVCGAHNETDAQRCLLPSGRVETGGTPLLICWTKTFATGARL